MSQAALLCGGRARGRLQSPPPTWACCCLRERALDILSCRFRARRRLGHEPWGNVGGRAAVCGPCVVTEPLSPCIRAFTTLCYSADGQSVLAGGRSKFVCIYHVGEQILRKKFEISHNLSLDAMEVSECRAPSPLRGYHLGSRCERTRQVFLEERVLGIS